MTDLTCQFMDVMFIPNGLDEIIRRKSHGIASWCEQLIKDMLGSEVIQIVDEDQAFPKKESFFDFLSLDASTTSLAFKNQKELSDLSRPRTPFSSESGQLRAGTREPRRMTIAVSRGLTPSLSGGGYQESGGSSATWRKERRRSTGATKSTHFNLEGLESKTKMNDSETDSGRGSRRGSLFFEEELPQEKPKFNFDVANFVPASENSMPLDTKKVCIINPGVDISKAVVPESVKDMVLARIDRMMPLEQVTLKCASILGTEFHRNVLQAILPRSCQGTFDLILYNLAKESILECASLAAQHQNAHSHHGFNDFNDPVHAHHHPYHHHHHHRHSVASTIQGSVFCGCYADEMTKVINLFRLMTPSGPKKHCLHLKFVNTYVQETIYSLWLEDQKRELHEKAAMFLESQAHKCKSCGGSGFVPKQGSQGQIRASGMCVNFHFLLTV